MTTLLILNDPPYGTERSYNGLRLALALAKLVGTQVSRVGFRPVVGIAPGRLTAFRAPEI